MKTYSYAINHPVPIVGRVIHNGEVRCPIHSDETDSPIYAKATYSNDKCAVCLKPLMFFTKVFTRFNDGTTIEENEVRTALVCGFTGKNRGGIVTQELLEYTLIGDI